MHRQPLLISSFPRVVLLSCYLTSVVFSGGLHMHMHDTHEHGEELHHLSGFVVHVHTLIPQLQTLRTTITEHESGHHHSVYHVALLAITSLRLERTREIHLDRENAVETFLAGIPELMHSDLALDPLTLRLPLGEVFPESDRAPPIA